MLPSARAILSSFSAVFDARWFRTPAPRARRRRDAASGDDTCSLALIADYLFYQARDSSVTNVVNAMVSYLDYVDGKSVFFLSLL